jgi:hypothetical protein
MTKRKSHSGGGENDQEFPDDPDSDEQHWGEDEQRKAAKPEEDPNTPHEFTVLTDGAMFPKDKLSMRKADVPAPAEPEGDSVRCGVGDIVSLTLEEAKAKRASGVALAERPEPTEGMPA